MWSGQRATPPGKCHSCNIRETPEWRRGPDGARTLCNACGLREFVRGLVMCPTLLIAVAQIMRNSCAKGINRSPLRARHPVSIWRRCELLREPLTWTSRIPVRNPKHRHLLKLLKFCPQMHLRLQWTQTISRTIKVLSRLLTCDPALQLVLTPLQHPNHTNSSLHQTIIQSLPRHHHRGLGLEFNHL